MIGVRSIALQIARTRSLEPKIKISSNRENTCDALNVTIRRTHCVRSQTGDILDSFFGPAELSDDLFVGHC